MDFMGPKALYKVLDYNPYKWRQSMDLSGRGEQQQLERRRRPEILPREKGRPSFIMRCLDLRGPTRVGMIL